MMITMLLLHSCFHLLNHHHSIAGDLQMASELPHPSITLRAPSLECSFEHGGRRGLAAASIRLRSCEEELELLLPLQVISFFELFPCPLEMTFNPYQNNMNTLPKGIKIV